jgi:hypothetical protein
MRSVRQDPGLSLPGLDPNADRFWTFWTKRLDFGCEVSGQILAEIFRHLYPCVRTRSDIDRTHSAYVQTRLDGLVVEYMYIWYTILIDDA